MSKLNLEYYTGKDQYSDGSVEDDILKYVTDNSDYTNILINETRWPVLYHLSPNRRNLLEWYDFKKGSSLLEIGAGCGALTGMFCEKVEKVISVELSKKRSEIVAQRNKSVNNLQIYVGNLTDMKFYQQFDYITLIGVLEYAGKFIESTDSYLELLCTAKKLLKPEGVLIVAIENKYGLKYWAGAKEDHTGICFSGIQDYQLDCGIRTFSRQELIGLVNKADFSDYDIYYPMPDYKLPTQIYTDEYLPEFGSINIGKNYDQSRYLFYEEKLVLENLSKEGMFNFFANSFLIFCKNAG